MWRKGSLGRRETRHLKHQGHLCSSLRLSELPPWQTSTAGCLNHCEFDYNLTRGVPMRVTFSLWGHPHHSLDVESCNHSIRRHGRKRWRTLLNRARWRTGEAVLALDYGSTVARTKMLKWKSKYQCGKGRERKIEPWRDGPRAPISGTWLALIPHLYRLLQCPLPSLQSCPELPASVIFITLYQKE